jgi:hypothetical protein
VSGGTLGNITGSGLTRSAPFTSTSGGPARIAVVGTSTGPDGTTIVIGDNAPNGQPFAATLYEFETPNGVFEYVHLVGDAYDFDAEQIQSQISVDAGIRHLIIGQNVEGLMVPYTDGNGKIIAGYIDDQGNAVVGHTLASDTQVGVGYIDASGTAGAYASLTLNATSTVGFIEAMGAINMNVLIGSVADDTLVVTPELLTSLGNFEIERVDGGIGIDTFALHGSDMALDLTALGSQINDGGGQGLPFQMQMLSIERIDLTGSGDNQLNLVLQDVLNIAGVNSFNSANGWGKTDALLLHQLVVDGNVGDTVSSSDWGLTVGSVVHSGVTYDIYNQAGAQLLINADLTLTTQVL